MEWINPEEQMPELLKKNNFMLESELVLIIDESGTPRLATLCEIENVKEWYSQNQKPINNRVIKWMHIPY